MAGATTISHGRFGRQTLVYAFGLWAVRAVGLLLVPLYTRRVSVTEYGVYEILGRTFDILCTVLPAGTVLSLVRFYGLARDEDKARVASTALLWPVGLGAMAAAAVWLLRTPLSIAIFHDEQYRALIGVVGLWVCFDLMFSVSTALLRARGQASLFSLANTGRALLTVGASVWLVWWRKLGITGILTANVLATAVPAVVFMIYALGSVGVRFSREQLKAFVGFGLPLLVTAALSTLSGVFDRFVLNAYMGPAAVAVYGIGTRLAVMLTASTVAPIALSYMPFVFANARRPEARLIFAQVSTQIVAAVVGCTLVLTLLAPEIIAMLAPSSYRNAVGLGRIYLVGACIYSVCPELEIGIYIKGATAWKIPPFAAMAATSVALNLLLIPRYGPGGAAFAYVCSQAVYFVSLYVISQRLYAIPYERRRLGKLVSSAIVLGLVGSGALPGAPVPSLPVRASFVLLFPCALWLVRFPTSGEAEWARGSAARVMDLLRTAVRLGRRVLRLPAG